MSQWSSACIIFIPCCRISVQTISTEKSRCRQIFLHLQRSRQSCLDVKKPPHYHSSAKRACWRCIIYLCLDWYCLVVITSRSLMCCRSTPYVRKSFYLAPSTVWPHLHPNNLPLPGGLSREATSLLHCSRCFVPQLPADHRLLWI